MPKWEQVTEDGSTWRLRVPGGWIVRYSDDIIHDQSDLGRGFQSGWDWRSSLVFVSDWNWEWTINE